MMAMGMCGQAQRQLGDIVGGMRGAPRRLPTCRRLHSTALLSCLVALIVGGGLGASGGEISAAQFFRVLEDMERAYALVDHYTALFLIQERVDGKLGPEQWIDLKFKKPFRFYLRWREGPNEGRQVLYPAGASGKELLVRVPLLVGAVTKTLDPNDARTRKGSRHPITDIGVGRLLEFIAGHARRGLQRRELIPEEAGQRTTFDRPTQRYVLRFPKDATEGYYCQTAVLDVDRELRLPIYVEIIDWQNVLVERYGYRDLRLNSGLTEADFDPKNPEYGF
jgi:outer membrane lipoprotein-sorting protein